MFNIGDKVRMNGKYILQEAHRGRVWTVMSEPRSACGVMVVTLDGLPGYAVDGLELVEKSGNSGRSGSMLKIGDKVKMNNNYYVSAENRDKIWTVRSEPWMVCGKLVVKLEGKAGGYAVDGLDLVEEGES